MKDNNIPRLIQTTLFCAAVMLVAMACTASSDLPTTPTAAPKDMPPTLTPAPSLVVSACPQPLDDETLNRLEFSMGALSGIHEMQPGESIDLSLGILECCTIFETVPACVTWLLEPESAGSLDPKTGELRVNPGTENGTVLTVTANIEDGKFFISQEILVYTAEQNPQVGYWSETGQLSCEDGTTIIPDVFIEELLFQADGRFSVTWSPFEEYRDYWGTYTFDLQTGSLALVIDRGNHIPENVDLNGQLQIDETGRLTLENIWLGEPPYQKLAPTCGHIFE